MLNENKIRWMTKASIYAKREGLKDLERNKYFFTDYVRSHLLKNFICVTIAYFILLGIFAVCKMEDIFVMMANLQIELMIKEAVIGYLIMLLIYMGLGIIVYSWQYQKSRQRVRMYYRMLKKIEECELEGDR